MWVLWVLYILYTVGTFHSWWWMWMHLLLCMCSCVHQLGSVPDGWRSLAAWRQTDSTAAPAPPPIYDGHNRWTHTYKNAHSHTKSWFIHNVFLKCSFGSSMDTADVTGHGLCTNYVWDSCEWRGPCQKSHHLLSKRGRQAESIPQHQQARFIQSRSRVCARNGLEVKKQHLWTKMDACLTSGSDLLYLHRLLNFPTIYLITGQKKYLCLEGLVV